MGTLKELLAAPDEVRITAPVLSRETMGRVLEILRSEAGSDRVWIDTPTQNLESYFLGVVQRARQSETATSGATSGGQVAAYLRGGADTPAGSDKILERLSLAEPAAPAQAEPVAPAVDDRRLDQLAQGEAKPEQSPQAKPVDLNEANRKLSGLLGSDERKE